MIRGTIRRFIVILVSIKTFFTVIYEFILWFFRRRITRGFLMLCLLLCASWVFGLFSYVDDMNDNIHEIIQKNPDIDEKTDAIIVLTGGSERIRQALYLLSKNYANLLFISGVNKDVRLSELLYLHGYEGEKADLISERIDLGYQAADTVENANEIAYWVKDHGFESIRIVTSNYHIRRASLEISNELPKIKIIRHGVIPMNIRLDKWWKFKHSRRLILSEYNKYIFANIRIFLENFGINIAKK